MKLLLDEHFAPVVADAGNALTTIHGLTFESLSNIAPGTKDPDIPKLCRRRSVAALVTANVRDFGARQALYEALLAAGVSVVVLRPGRVKLTPTIQAALLMQHSKVLEGHLSLAKGPVLIRVTASGVVHRTLQELRDEITKGKKLP